MGIDRCFDLLTDAEALLARARAERSTLPKTPSAFARSVKGVI